MGPTCPRCCIAFRVHISEVWTYALHDQKHDCGKKKSIDPFNGFGPQYPHRGSKAESNFRHTKNFGSTYAANTSFVRPCHRVQRSPNTVWMTLPRMTFNAKTPLTNLQRYSYICAFQVAFGSYSYVRLKYFPNDIIRQGKHRRQNGRRRRI